MQIDEALQLVRRRDGAWSGCAGTKRSPRGRGSRRTASAIASNAAVDRSGDDGGAGEARRDEVDRVARRRTTTLSPGSASTHIRCASPSFAPIVLTTCVSGSSATPKRRSYSSQIACAQLRDSAARRVAVVRRLRGGLAELLDGDVGRRDVRIAEAEVDHVATFAPQLSLQLVDGRKDIGREIVDTRETSFRKVL